MRRKEINKHCQNKTFAGLLAAVILGCAGIVFAQSPVDLGGRLVDRQQQPLSGCRVSLLHAALETQSDNAGKFAFKGTGIPAVTGGEGRAPFLCGATLHFPVRGPGQKVVLDVYDFRGKKAAAVLNEERPAGWYEADMSQSLPHSHAGLYTVRLKTGGESMSLKLPFTGAIASGSERKAGNLRHTPLGKGAAAVLDTLLISCGELPEKRIALTGYSPDLGNIMVGLPNIVIILADDMGWGDAGFNGCTDFPTPAIDAIAAQGVRFTNGYVMAPQCAPSRSALLAGKDQNRILANNNMTLDSVGLPEGRTMADFLKDAGYRTGIVGKWHLGTQDSKHPLNRGFDEFYGFLGGGHHYFPHLLKFDDRPEARGSYNTWIMRNHGYEKTSKYLTDEFGDNAVKFIEESKDRPFFLYLSFNAPHTPMQAPEEEIKRYAHLQSKHELRPTYAAMVVVMDRNIRKVLDALEDAGIAGNTMVVFLSDNGGGTVANNGSDNGPLRGAKGDTFEGGIRVPFAIKWPGVVAPGGTIEEPVLSIDLLPTALAAAGRPVPGDLEGVSLLPALSGAGRVPERKLNWMFTLTTNPNKWWWAAREGEWKLVYCRVVGQDTVENGLFHLHDDIGEQRDLSASNRERRDRLQKLHDAWFDGLPEPFSNL